jgi:hypothetical protein
MISDYEVKRMQCPECNTIMNLTVFKGEIHRCTYCMTCGHAVWWTAVCEHETYWDYATSDDDPYCIKCGLVSEVLG